MKASNSKLKLVLPGQSTTPFYLAFNICKKNLRVYILYYFVKKKSNPDIIEKSN